MSQHLSLEGPGFTDDKTPDRQTDRHDHVINNGPQIDTPKSYMKQPFC